MEILQLLFMFGLALLIEACYVSCVYFVTQGVLLRVPVLPELFGVFRVVLFIQYIHTPRMVIALALGQLIGACITLRVLRRM